MKIILILISVMILFSFSVLATYSQSDGYVIADNFDNRTDTSLSGDCAQYPSSSCYDQDVGGRGSWNVETTVPYQVYGDVASTNGVGILLPTHTSNLSCFYNTTNVAVDVSNVGQFWFRCGGSVCHGMSYLSTGTASTKYIEDWPSGTDMWTFNNGNWNALILTMDETTGKTSWYVFDETTDEFIYNQTVGSTSGTITKFEFYDDGSGGNNMQNNMTEWYCWNGTIDDKPLPADVNPPTLSGINCTSPNPDKNMLNNTFGCLTTDSTPTFDIHCTDDIACTGVKAGTENLSYADLPTTCSSSGETWTCNLGTTIRQTHGVYFQATDGTNFDYDNTFLTIGDCAYNSDCTATQMCLFNYTCADVPSLSCLNVRAGCSVSYANTCIFVSP